MPQIMEILDEDFKKDKMYTDETVGKLMKAMESRFKDAKPKPYTLTKNQASINNKGETLLSVDRGPQVNTNNGNLHNNEMEEYLAGFPKKGDNAKVGAIFHVGNANVTDAGSTGGTHFITAVFDPGSKKLTIVDSLGEPENFYDSYQQSGDAIIKGFKDKFGDNITVEINPKEYFLKQSDSTSCGVASVYVLDHLLQDNPIAKNTGLGIQENLTDNYFELVDGAEKLRASQKQQIEKYNEDNMSKKNGSELDEEEIRSTTSSTTRYGTQDDEEAKKRRTSLTHPAPGDEQEAENFIGSSPEITALWQQRDEELKKILNSKYPTPITDDKGQATTTPTADELIKHYNILDPNNEDDEKVRKEIYNYNQKFSTELAEAMSAAVKDGNGNKLDFSSKKFQSDPKITINTGDRDLEIPVTINTAGRKEIKFTPDTLQPGDNFTISLAFQDEHGRNMPKDGALYYQIRVENGKITSTNAPKLKQDENGQYYAEGPKGNKVYPKVDRATIERNLGLQAELADDIVVDHNTNYAPLTKENRAKLPDENNKQKRSSRDSDSDTASIASGSGKSEESRPATPPTPPPSRSNSVSNASDSGKSEHTRPATPLANPNVPPPPPGAKNPQDRAAEEAARLKKGLQQAVDGGYTGTKYPKVETGTTLPNGFGLDNNKPFTPEQMLKGSTHPSSNTFTPDSQNRVNKETHSKNDKGRNS